jgi:hypothetical protein
VREWRRREKRESVVLIARGSWRERRLWVKEWWRLERRKRVVLVALGRERERVFQSKKFGLRGT